MKKLVSVFLVMVLCISLCACGKPDIDSCVLNANTLVSGHQSILGGSYMFSGEYLEEDNTYVIIMSIDEEGLLDIMQGANETYSDLIWQIAVNNLDQDTDTISFELKTLKDSVVPLFEKTDVSVITGYVDSEGTVTRYE